MRFGIPELLAPAGGRKQLEAAVANGADAVYMSGNLFNARAAAENFDDEGIKDAIAFAHTYGVRVHITMNILIMDGEMEQALEFARRMYEYGADALIIQDLGLMAEVKRLLPDMPVHFSTQGTVYDAEGVREAARLGASRVILARELSLDEIRDICMNTDTEIEIFVHGAICICYSGQCHLSGVIGGRSGNRGQCAQPCRLPYRLLKDGGRTGSEGFILSPSDMSLLSHLREIAEAGVASLKIEGRMKSPEYVAAVTAVYRKHLDRLAEGGSVSMSETASDNGVLRQMYSRGPFTDAYFEGESGDRLMSGESPKHQGIQAGRIRGADRRRGHLRVELSSELAVGDVVEVRTGNASLSNIVTYMRTAGGKLIKEAEPGMTVTIGDFDMRSTAEIPEGHPVCRLTDSRLMKAVRKTCEKIPPRIGTDFRLEAVTGRRAVLEASCVSGGRIISARTFSSEELEPAEGKALDPQSAGKSLSRTGGTPYIMNALDTVIKGDPFFSAGELNSMRRAVLEELTARRLETGRETGRESSANDFVVCKAFTDTNTFVQTADGYIPETVIYFHDSAFAEEKISSVLEDIEAHPGFYENTELAVPYRLLISGGVQERLFRSGAKVSAVLPAVSRGTAAGNYERTEKLLSELYGAGKLSSVYAGNVSQLEILRKTGIPLRMDMQMNIMNSAAIRDVFKRDAVSAMLSAEPDAVSVLTEEDLSSCEIQVYGRIPAMISAHCPLGSESGGIGAAGRKKCTPEKKYHYCRSAVWELEDRKRARFTVWGNDENCSAVIYSHTAVDRTGELEKFVKKQVGRLRISVLNEEIPLIRSKIEIIKDICRK